jgi:hypothetical protein
VVSLLWMAQQIVIDTLLAAIEAHGANVRGESGKTIAKAAQPPLAGSGSR